MFDDTSSISAPLANDTFLSTPRTPDYDLSPAAYTALRDKWMEKIRAEAPAIVKGLLSAGNC